jgi:hypothetical protein
MAPGAPPLAQGEAAARAFAPHPRTLFGDPGFAFRTLDRTSEAPTESWTRDPLSLCDKHRDDAVASPLRADRESVPAGVLAAILLAIASKQ